MTRADILLRAAIGLLVFALMMTLSKPGLGGERKRIRREVRPAHRVPVSHRHKGVGRCLERGRWRRGCS